MAYQDLRAFLARLEAEGKLARARATVDLQYEIGATRPKTPNARGPALLFERPGDSAHALADHLLASRRRLALGLEKEPSKLVTWQTFSILRLKSCADRA